MIKQLVFLVCLGAGAHGALAADRGLTWNSMAVYVGKTPNSMVRARVNTWMAWIESRQPDASGYYEVWTDSQPFYQETDASQVALEFRSACNKTRSNACVHGQQPAWNERLDKVIFVH